MLKDNLSTVFFDIGHTDKECFPRVTNDFNKTVFYRKRNQFLLGNITLHSLTPPRRAGEDMTHIAPVEFYPPLPQRGPHTPARECGYNH